MKNRGEGSRLLLTRLPVSPGSPNLLQASGNTSVWTFNRLSFVPSRPARLTHSASADTINSSPTGLEHGRQLPRRIPMKLAYFDCFSGISGDMTLGALVDAGCDVEHLRAELSGLQVPGWELTAEKVWKNGMAATYVKVKTEDQQTHRSLSAILEILQKSQLVPQVRERAAAIFSKLGEAEARVHDVPLEKIHFHEVGAVDAIVDIVGACIGLHALGIEKFACSAFNYGGGTADFEGQPNVVRIMIGEAADKTVAGFDEEIAVIEANLDDMNPQIYGYFLEKALAAGALDVY